MGVFKKIIDLILKEKIKRTKNEIKSNENEVTGVSDSELSVIFGLRDDDYICLTDMVKAGDNSDRTNIVIQNWMRRKDTISYLGVWENLHNPHFNCIEFDAIKSASGTNRFILTAKEWIERTGACGIISKAGRYGGTYAHKDIAYHFGMWLSPEFNLLVVKVRHLLPPPCFP